MSDRPRSWDVERPTAPPDHSDLHDVVPIARPVEVGDRVAWVTAPTNDQRPRRLRGRKVERLATVDELDPFAGGSPGGMWLRLDGHDPARVYAPAAEVFPRPGR